MRLILLLTLVCLTGHFCLPQQILAAEAPSGDSISSEFVTIPFPVVKGSNLEGRDFVLPRDFEGDLNLVFIAFERDQQTLVDSWIPTTKSLIQSYAGLRYYELPTIKKMNWVMRSIINRGMRSGIPDKEARKATITLYMNKDKLKQPLGLPHEDTIYVLLVDAAGKVVWRVEGARTGAKEADLRAAIADALPEGPVELPTEEDTMSETMEVATLGGGCFWCLEAVYDELKGVKQSVSGYAGGTVPNPSYKQVCSETTGHAEVVQITFDPNVTSFEEILEIFFTIHDPTTLNRQGADVGTQYRSAVFYHSQAQRKTTEEMIHNLSESGGWDNPIVTEVKPLDVFYAAEDYHQEYFKKNPNQAYCAVVVAPKVTKFRKKYSDRLKLD